MQTFQVSMTAVSFQAITSIIITYCMLTQRGQDSEKDWLTLAWQCAHACM